MTLLTGFSLLAVNILIIFCILYFIQRIKGTAVVGDYIKNNAKIVKSWLADIHKDKTFVCLLVLAIGVMVLISALGLLFPVVDFDGNSYHMPYIAHVIQEHHIYDMHSSITWLTGYPKGGEFIQMWNVLIPQNDALADLAQLPFLLLGVVALYVISLRVGVRKSDARFASLFFIFIPVVINQAKTTYVDVLLCALFFAALAMVTMKKLSKLDLVIIGIIYSILISVKSTGALFVVATLPFLLQNILVIKNKKLEPKYRQYVQSLSLVAIPIAFGLYWYVKNWVLYGSPLYPFGFSLFGKSIFPGKTFHEFIASAFTNGHLLPEGSLQKVWFTWTEQQDWFGCMYNYDATFSGMGPLWFVVMVPSIFVSFIIAIKKRNYLFLAIAIMLSVLFLAYPANFYARYTIFMVAVGVTGYGLITTTLGGWVRTVTRALVIFLSFVVIATSFTLCNFPPSTVREQMTAVRNGSARDSTMYKNTVGAAFVFVQNNLASGETVAYGSSPYFVYPLWKGDFSNRVIYIEPTHKDEWLLNVEQSDTKYVFTNLKGIEHAWANESEKLTSVYKDDLYEVFETR